MTDFQTAARAEGRVLADEWMQKNGGPQTNGHHIAHTSIIYGFRAGAEWARDHLAAQELEVTIRHEEGKPATCEVRRNEELVFAGRDHSAELRVAAQEPTDVEIEAAARALYAEDVNESYTEWPAYDSPQNVGRDLYTERARYALSAARAARRDEEKHDG